MILDDRFTDLLETEIPKKDIDLFFRKIAKIMSIIMGTVKKGSTTEILFHEILSLEKGHNSCVP